MVLARSVIYAGATILAWLVYIAIVDFPATILSSVAWFAEALVGSDRVHTGTSTSTRMIKLAFVHICVAVGTVPTRVTGAVVRPGRPAAGPVDAETGDVAEVYRDVASGTGPGERTFAAKIWVFPNARSAM
jgi:hypothetical protein